MTAAKRRKASTPKKIDMVSPQLFALGLLVEGAEADLPFVRESLVDALRSADATFAQLAIGKQPEPTERIITEAWDSKEYKTLQAMAPKNETELVTLVDNVMTESIFLGMSLAWRFLRSGVA